MKRVLIVDDHPGARTWLSRAVHACFPGCELQLADTFSGGMLALQQTQLPELCLFDLGLPDGNGVQLVARYRQLKPDGLAVVASLFDDDGHLFDALRAGADGYVLKDEPEAEIMRLLAGIHAGQPPLSASIARRVLAFFCAQVRPKSTPGTSQTTPENNADLTPREVDTLKLVAKGFNVPRVAELLGLSKHTVAGYLRDVYRKLAVNTRAEATLAAAQMGLIGGRG